MADSLRNRLRDSGITLSVAEVDVVTGMMREEILQRYVIARGRIKRLKRLDEIKQKIVDQIYVTLGKHEAVKMKGFFDLLIPALVDIIKIQRCALFSVMEDREHVMLESGYPEAEHGVGQVFSVKEPYIDAVVNLNLPVGDFENETVRRDYIFVKYPQESALIPASLKYFLATRGVHSVLYIPLLVGGRVKHFLTFDSQDQRERFSKEEIEILAFLGKELMKGLKLEKLGDILHDFRNPAIAAAGFSKRVKEMLQQGLFPIHAEKIYRYLDFIYEETVRIQDLALTLYGEGKEIIIDLTDRLRKRFIVNSEVLKELNKPGVHLTQQESGPVLPVRCYPLHIDRVLDNLLSNATQAIPDEGGELSFQSYQEGSWGVAEIVNTGRISEEDRKRLLLDEYPGRGLHISLRLVKYMGGRLELETREEKTVVRVFLPIAAEGARIAGPPPPARAAGG